MGNAYLSLDTLTGTAALNVGTAYDTRLLGLIENVSRQVDKFCNRVFYFYHETKTFSGDGSRELPVPDLVKIGTLLEDNNDDGTFDTTWAVADYLYEPINANPTADWGRPYSRIKVSLKVGGAQDVFLQAEQNYQIVGTWGYRKVMKDSGLNGTLANGTATSLVLDGSASGTVDVGHTILMDAEQVYVTAYSGTAATVERAKNGSTGTAHANADVNIILYPGPISEAVLIQTARLWKRKDSGFASQIGMPETGQMMTMSGLDRDVKELIQGYRKLVIP